MQKTVFAFLFLFLTSSCSVFGPRDRETAELYLKLGSSQFENGQYPQALSSFLSAERADPENPYVQNNMGLVYFMRGKLELAEKHLRQAIDLKSDFSDAKNNLSRILIERAQYDEALRWASEVEKDLTYPNPEKPLINLGLANFRMKNFEKAKAYFKQALDAQRESCLAHSMYGRSFFELKEYINAAEALDKAVGFCQTNQFDEPQYFGGLSYLRSGQRDKAIARFEELLKIYPNGKYRENSRKMLETIRR